MSRRTLVVSGILVVYLTEVVLPSILVNLNMQREGAWQNLNRELLLRLRRAAPKLDYTLASNWRLWAVLATAEAAAPAAKNRNINSHWDSRCRWPPPAEEHHRPAVP